MTLRALVVVAVVSMATAPHVAFADVPAPGPSATPQESRPTVWIHIDAGRDVVLNRQPLLGGGWREECHSPCDRHVPLDDEYFISGPDIVGSRTLLLDARAGDRVVLDVRPSLRSARDGGAVVAALGGVVGLVGYLGVMISMLMDSVSCDNLCGHGARPDGTSVAILVSGAAIGVTGLVVLLANASKSRVRQTSTSAKRADAYERDAAWRTPQRGERGAPSVGVPIFSHSF